MVGWIILGVVGFIILLFVLLFTVHAFITIDLKDDFALINANCEKVVEPGEFVVMAGKSSKDEDLLKVSVII